jgi:quaternary ammonium compound-resistance protein SugE
MAGYCYAEIQSPMTSPHQSRAQPKEAEAMTSQLSLRVILILGFVIVTQVAGASLLAKTDGFRDPTWTAACLAIYVVSLFALAETIRQGMALSLVMPILAAVVPIATIAVAVLVFKEHASWMRLGILTAACLMVGVASTV